MYNLSSFCKHESEIINHLLSYCPHSNSFRKLWAILFGIKKTMSPIKLKNILMRILTYESPLLNYLVVLGKKGCNSQTVTHG